MSFIAGYLLGLEDGESGGDTPSHAHDGATFNANGTYTHSGSGAWKTVTVAVPPSLRELQYLVGNDPDNGDLDGIAVDIGGIAGLPFDGKAGYGVGTYLAACASDDGSGGIKIFVDVDHTIAADKNGNNRICGKFTVSCGGHSYSFVDSEKGDRTSTSEYRNMEVTSISAGREGVMIGFNWYNYYKPYDTELKWGDRVLISWDKLGMQWTDGDYSYYVTG